jgi:two-component SAPR family response regulator
MDMAPLWRRFYSHLIMPLANYRDKVAAGSLGYPRLRIAVRQKTGRYVAGGDCQWIRNRWKYSQRVAFNTAILAPGVRQKPSEK